LHPCKSKSQEPLPPCAPPPQKREEWIEIPTEIPKRKNPKKSPFQEKLKIKKKHVHTKKLMKIMSRR
jgi:hypothetical protein